MADAFFYYGSYTHAANSVGIRSIQKSLLLSPNGKTHALRHQWMIEGKLVISAGDLATQLNEVLNAYSIGGQSFGFVGSSLSVDSAATLGGVLVTSPVSFESIFGAHGVTYQKFTVGLQADFPWVVSGTVLDFQETMQFVDHQGGPIYVERMPAVGPPLFQQVTERSWYYATQSGSITTAFSNPQPMAPVWPQFIRTIGPGGNNRVYSSPKMQRGIAMSYTTSWRYDYASPEQLTAYPNVRA